MGNRYLTLLLLVVGCAAQAPAPPTPQPEATCATACARLRELSCDEGKPTDEGGTCEEVCANAGMAARYSLACVIELSQCVYLNGCAL